MAGHGNHLASILAFDDAHARKLSALPSASAGEMSPPYTEPRGSVASATVSAARMARVILPKAVREGCSFGLRWRHFNVTVRARRPVVLSLNGDGTLGDALVTATMPRTSLSTVSPTKALRQRCVAHHPFAG